MDRLNAEIFETLRRFSNYIATVTVTVDAVFNPLSGSITFLFGMLMFYL